MHREELAEIRNKNNQNLNLTTKFPQQNQPLKLAGLALAVTDKCRKIPYSMRAFLFHTSQLAWRNFFMMEQVNLEEDFYRPQTNKEKNRNLWN